ncbi:TonB-dependent receptor [Rhizomicrobium palustre]|uniref:TonB-dependent receptor n=1 Tax=Rhizomicrobium palustre TaxID=189966 RepID=A0A846MVP3_9PROT|nr:TonB-dependent receptor [Rhizomicrobium palustre]
MAGWVIGLGAGAAAISSALLAEPLAHDFAIEAGNLTSAIQALSLQGDVQIMTAVNTARLKTPPVHGMMRASEALARLLSGLPIKAEYVAGGYVLKHAAPEPVNVMEEVAPEEVVITGYRGSLQRAIDLKFAAVISQDSIVADDIAAFPDINLAESMQRIPGVAITRDSGEGRQITIRSLGPDFARTQINGMEVLGNTASGMDNRGLVSRTRSFDFSLFSSELFSSVTIEKSYAADQDEGGIAGTAKLRTPKPFDFPGFKMAVSGKAMVNTSSATPTPHLAALVSNRWGNFGALVAIAASTANSVEYGYRNWGWHQAVFGSANIGVNISQADAQTLLAGKIYLPIAETYSSWFNHRTRIGATAALQYRPSDHLDFDLDVMFGHLSNNRKDYALAAAGTNGLTVDITGTQRLDDAFITQNSLLKAGFSHVDLRSEANEMKDATDFYQAALTGRMEVNESLTLHALVGVSRSAYGLPVFDKVFLETQNRNFQFDYTTPNRPINGYGGTLTEPGEWNLMRLDSQEEAITSRYFNAKLDLEWRVFDGVRLSSGMEYKSFSNGGWNRSNKVFYNDPADRPLLADDKFVLTQSTVAPYVVGAVDATYNTIGQARALTVAYTVPGSDYSLGEDTLAGYVKLDGEASLFGFPLRGNIGFRYFSTWISSRGTLNNGSSLAPVAISYRYDDVLPAANLVISLADNLLTRFSANRNISRPALSDLAAAGTLTTAPFGGTVSTGNPYLRPFFADSVEASLEYYDRGSSYASLGVFYKNMEDFITTATTVMPYSQTGFPLSFLLPHQNPDVLYNYTAPVNGKGADFAGMEVAIQHDFKFLPAPFDRFGVTGNFTYVDGNSRVIFNGRAVSLPLLNLSKFSYNATLYYEGDRFSVRVSQAYRGGYRGGPGANGNVGDYYAATSNVDFALHYRIGDHLKATLEGINMTDQPIIQYTDATAKRLEVVTRSGRTFTFGIAYET